MAHRHEISDADWNRIKNLLPGQPGQHGGVADNNRRFINAGLYVARTGIPWRDLPTRLGHWNSQWRRFDRWAKAGHFATLAAVFRDPDLDLLVLDSTIIRAHPCAAGQKKSGMDRVVNRSRRSVAVAADLEPNCTAVVTVWDSRSSCS
jgi:transposase